MYAVRGVLDIKMNASPFFSMMLVGDSQCGPEPPISLCRRSHQTAEETPSQLMPPSFPEAPEQLQLSESLAQILGKMKFRLLESDPSRSDCERQRP
jgi:hypothetical protein